MKRLRLAAVAAMLILVLLPPAIAFAQSVLGADKALPPPSGISPLSGSGNQLVAGDGLQIRFINRATVEIVVNYGDRNIFPGSSNNLKYSDVLGETLTRQKHNDRNYGLNVPQDGSLQDALKRAFGTALELNNGESDDLSTRWKVIDTSTDAFEARYLNASKLRIRTMLAPDGYGCNPNLPGGDFNTDYLGLINATDDNIEDSDNTIPVAWACAGGDGADEIIGLQTRYTDRANYNITHLASADGKQLTVVFSGNDLAKDSFKYCENGTYALSLEDGTCESGGRDGYTISAQPEDFLNSNNVTVTLKRNGSDVGNMVVAGAQSSSNVGPSVGDVDTAPSCEDNGGVLSWIVCPILDFIDRQIESLDNTIQTILEVPSNDYADDGNLNKAWQAMRNIAYIILLPIMLVMVIGTALGFEFLSAYTVKKALPRLVAATVFIALSWEICQFLITLTNNVGAGVLGLITSPFGDSVPTSLADVLGGGGGLLAIAATGVVAGGAVFVLGTALIGILLSYGFVALVALFMGFFVLVLRQVFLLVLVLAAPLAILAWIFPGNDKLWKGWWGTFSKLLIMYPLIVALIAMGRVFAGVSSVSQDGLIGFLIKIIAYIAPYFFIPATFKFAGGVFATVSGMANDKGRGLFDRQRKSRQEKAAEGISKWKSGDRAARTWVGRANRRVGQGIGVGAKGRFGIGTTGASAIEQMESLSGAAHAKSDAGQAGQHNDWMLRAQTYSSEAEARRSMAQDWGMQAHEVETGLAAARANGGWGRARAVHAAKQLSVTGTGYDDLNQVAQTISRVSGGNGSMISSLSGDINASAKAANRPDLSPGYSDLRGLAQAASDGTLTADQLSDARRSAARGFDAVTLLRGKPAEVQATTQTILDEMSSQWGVAQDTSLPQAQRDAAMDRVLQAAGQVKQLEDSRSYASPINQEHVNRLLNSTAAIRSALAPQVSRPAVGPPGPHADRWEQVSTPPKNPNDPRLP